MSLTLLIQTLAIASGLFSVAMVFRAGDFSEPFLIVIGILFAAWAAAPFAIPYWRAGEVKDAPVAGLVILVATIAALAFAFYSYWSAFIGNPNPDAQDGMIMVVLPF